MSNNIKLFIQWTPAVYQIILKQDLKLKLISELKIVFVYTYIGITYM